MSRFCYCRGFVMSRFCNCRGFVCRGFVSTPSAAARQAMGSSAESRVIVLSEVKVVGSIKICQIKKNTDFSPSKSCVRNSTCGKDHMHRSIGHRFICF